MLPAAGATRALHFRISKTACSNQLTSRQPRHSILLHESYQGDLPRLGAHEWPEACLSEASVPRDTEPVISSSVMTLNELGA